MKDRPILFSGPMVRALLEGRKTQTRRIAKGFVVDLACITGDCPHGLAEECAEEIAKLCPYGVPGGRLWVRETFYCDSVWYPDGEPDGLSSAAVEGGGFRALTTEEKRRDMLATVDYRATHSCHGYEAGCPCTLKLWRPSIFMPRWASRITLEVVSVRVERLQEISEADAIAEGVDGPDSESAKAAGWCLTPQGAYRFLWESINGQGSWDANPFVWVVEFKRIGGGA